ncbi:MAG: ABC transporter ATP-binding protein [Streptomyces sp.]|nr:ABC transporter ATP-binding protein [Streptomyces sp.]
MAARTCPWRLALAVVLTFSTGITAPLAAWETRSVLDAITAHRGGGLPVTPVVLVCAAGVVGAVLPSLLSYLQSQIRRAIALRVQDDLFAAVNRFQGLARFEDPAFHDRLLLAQQNGQSAPSQLANAVLSLLRSVVTVLGFATAVLTLSPLMGGLAVASAVPGAVAQIAGSRRRAAGMWRTSPFFRRRMLAQSLLTDPRAVKEVRAFALGDFFRARVREDQQLINGIEQSIDARVTWTESLYGSLGAALTAAATAWALWRAAKGDFTVGDVTVLLAAAGGIQSTLAGTAGAFSQGHSSALLYAHFRAVVTAGPDLPLPAAPRHPQPLRHGIELRDVWFRYSPGGPWVLRGVDLTLPAGQAVALVGANGAGKSTIVKLLLRMYDPERGAVLWDGTDIREFDPAELRDRIGTVLQDFMNYELTARENIAVGDVRRLDDHAAHEAAARRSGSHDFLSGLPQGYATMLSRIQVRPVPGRTARKDTAEEPEEPGVIPSGGQWQRIAIARGLLRRDRDFLVLDEPSAGLDPHAEAEIHRTLRTLRDGATSLLISHRLGALRDADTIVVLDSGRVTERGTHEQLLGLGGSYAEMFAVQAEGYRSDAPPPAAPAAAAP